MQAALGQADSARASIERTKEIVPTFTMELYEKSLRVSWHNREDIVEPLMRGLHELGLE